MPKYLLKFSDGREKVIENMVYEKLVERADKIGATVTEIVPTPKPMVRPKPVEDLDFYTMDEGANMFRSIKDKYYPDLENVGFMFKSWRSSRRLGRAWYQTKTVELSTKLLNAPSSKFLKQVIYHELAHIKYPGGHTAPGFRYMERNNPFRFKKSRRLTCVS